MTTDGGGLEVTILLPCLDEVETVGSCVRTAIAWLASSGTTGEVLVADNGSTDGSQELARAAGARVVTVTERGYGAALRGGLAAARGDYVIMGDADATYDFSRLDPFLERLRAGDQLVIGNRFAGGIDDGAMPWLHRLGNPVLSALGRRFYDIDVGDFHCGLRAVDRRAALDLGLDTTGMEFASELIVKASLARHRISEVPTTLSAGGRSRPPHLRTWSDGWRHVRFLLLLCPRWLFKVPGTVALVVGGVLTCVLTWTDVDLGRVTLSIGTLIYAAALMIIGLEAVMFARFAELHAARHGLRPPDDGGDAPADPRIGRGIALGLLFVAGGLAMSVLSLWRWSEAGFGRVDPVHNVRIVMPAALGLVMGTTIVLSRLLLAVLQLPLRSPPAQDAPTVGAVPSEPWVMTPGSPAPPSPSPSST